MSGQLRLLTHRDIGAALELSTLAGWNQTAEDWIRLRRLQPDGCFCISANDRPVSTATLLRYGTRLGWVGMVLTHPDFRKQGYARQLLQQTLNEADRAGVQTLMLDATDQGQPLYESLGFVWENPIERWTRNPGQLGKPAGPLPTESLPLTLDREAFGADRATLLEDLRAGGDSYATGSGYLLTRPGRVARHFGPLVAERDAELLLEEALARYGDQPIIWDLVPGGPAEHLAGKHGFSLLRRLVRMRRGAPIQVRQDMLYAAAGFELG